MGIYQQEPSSVTLLPTVCPLERQEQQAFPVLVEESLVTTLMQRRRIFDDALRQLETNASIAEAHLSTTDIAYTPSPAAPSHINEVQR